MAYSLKYKFRKFIKCDCLCCVKIPAAIIDGKYRLRLEGYDNEHPQKAILIKESPLEFYPDFLSIVIQSNRKVFRNGMSGNLTHIIRNLFLNSFLLNLILVRFRIILTQMDLKPYTDPVTIYIMVLQRELT